MTNANERSGHLRLKGLLFWGRHGHLPFEKETGNRFKVDVDLEVDLSEAVHSDRLEDTVDLAQVCEVVRRLMEGESCTLIETLAHRIAEELVRGFPVKSVTVMVRKTTPPLPGAVGGVSEAEVTRVSGHLGRFGIKPGGPRRAD